MTKRRFGRFQFKDYWSSWVGISILCFISITGLCLKMNPFISSFPIILSLIWILIILFPYRECFQIDGSVISVTKGRELRQIEITENTTLVISYTYPHALYGLKSLNILKNKYSLSFVSDSSVDDILGRLHKSYPIIYTNSNIESAFNYQFLYSFVCDQATLDQILNNGSYTLIIPESLKNHFTVNSNSVTKYIDIGY